MSKTVAVCAAAALAPLRKARRRLLYGPRRKMLATAAMPESRAQ